MRGGVCLIAYARNVAGPAAYLEGAVAPRARELLGGVDLRLVLSDEGREDEVHEEDHADDEEDEEEEKGEAVVLV